MASYIWRLVVLLLLGLQAGQGREFIVGGYLPDYRAYINVNATAPFLTDLILFSVTPSGDGCCLGEHHYRLAREAQAYKQEQGHGSLRLWVSVGGGGGRSDSFSGIATDSEKRKQLIHNLVQLCKREGLQGVDFDWEIPRSAKEQQAYGTMLIEASESLNKADLLISVALHPRQFMPQRVYDEMDRIHFMAYDLDRFHVAHYDSVVKAVEEFTTFGGGGGGPPVSKMVLGIPAYSRHPDDGLVKTFAELMDESSDAAVSRHVWNGYPHDTPTSIHQKVEYALVKKMAGVFFWELGQDKQHSTLGPGGILLEAAAGSVERILHGRTQQGEEL